ncbi:MAG: 3-methyladenine DNA glycosylase 2 [Betaproteobacteria bacterium HGW-Betaproteobacteria-7]|jgi:DNA-3-methyladenine glycosylase II|nr:MAG: 3-methyladenine DNA glycosylase 2 [Betaproteobacteria bacterium HGW-Betaproteobacteria-7]
MAPTQCRLELPVGFRPADILEFHGRDVLAVGERTTADRLEKGLIWQGQPACLSIIFQPGSAEAELAIDGGSAEPAALMAAARRLLGLDQPVEAFERAHAGHPQLGPLLARQAGLRVPQAATPFEALSWAITGQQISLGAAVSLRRKLLLAAGLRHSGGLLCYPDAARVAALDEARLRGAGFSGSKTQTLLAVSRLVEEGALPLDDWLAAQPAEEVRERLLAVRGIGPWTVDYVLLRGYGWLDGSLHGDAAVRRALGRLLDRAQAPDEKEARSWLVPFAPWRALLAAHLWASLALAA